jgi:membrane protease YdiL (CAAX protease family)
MDRRLALGALVAIPVLYALLAGLTSALGPLGGWALGLLAYWAGLGLALGTFADRDRLAELLVARAPGRLVTLFLALPVIAYGATVLRLLGQEPLPPTILMAVALGAVANATLEELFWRGALLPRPTPGAAALALGLFALFHLAWLGARGLDTGAGPLAPVLAALALGGVWTASRLLSGTVGAAILSHTGFNLFAFSAIAARTWEAA